MKKVVIFSGTTEGRKLAMALSGAKIEAVVCVATEYGKEEIKQNDDERVDQSEDYSVKIYADQRKLCLLGGFLGYSQHIRHFTSILSCCSLPEIKAG